MSKPKLSRCLKTEQERVIKVKEFSISRPVSLKNRIIYICISSMCTSILYDSKIRVLWAFELRCKIQKNYTV